ncbi:MAG: tripartite tricarboxylate transporter TctB family protein [Synergistaceae bacterium]|jgi:hypothetical protein|nr:tripartite tricarboxylate transporter TctB family protein [Synergistaceae bacterium]
MTNDQRGKFISNDLIIGAFLAIVAVIFLAQAVNFRGISRYFPTMALSLFLILSLCEFGMGIRKTLRVRRGLADDVNPELKARPFTLFGLMCVYVFCIQHIGFFVTSAIYLPVAMLLYGQRDSKKIVPVTIGVLAFLYWMFVIQMKLHMPNAWLF